MKQFDKNKFYERAFSVSTDHEGRVIYDIHRGEIYFYQFTGKEVGCEMKGESGVDRRPCVVVSNDRANAFTGLVTVVPMTSKEKSPIPTRVPYEGKVVHGTFLCEQVITISNERLLNFCGEVDEGTMKRLDAALCVQLELSASNSVPPPVPHEDPNIRALEGERDFYKRSYFELIDRMTGRKS